MSHVKTGGPTPVEAPYTDHGQPYTHQPAGPSGETDQQVFSPPSQNQQGDSAQPTAPSLSDQAGTEAQPYTVSGQQQQQPTQQGAYPPQQYSSGAYPAQQHYSAGNQPPGQQYAPAGNQPPGQQYAPAGNQPPGQQYSQAPGPAMPGYAAPGYAAPGYGPPPQPGVTIITASRPPVFGPNPCTMQCPHCQANITTTVDRKIGTAAWAAVGIICLIGLFIFPLVLLGCCFIPLCIPSMKDAQHTCPNCQKQLGFYGRMR